VPHLSDEGYLYKKPDLPVKLLSRILIPVCAALAFTYNSNVNGHEAGDAAPNCALTSFTSGQRYNLQQFLGKVLYVDFWASWCSPCARSFPFMNDLDREFRGRGLQIVGINVDEKPEDAQAFLAKYPASFMVAFDAGGQCARKIGVKGMPSAYLVDRQGVIRHVHLGFRSGDMEKLRGLVEQLLANSLAGQ
jgi:thiol-disulfide isomerase/thioredoxin